MQETYTDTSHIDADHITTGEWIEKWLQLYVTPRVRASTQNLYYGLMHRYAILELGMIPLSKLTEFDIQAVIFGPLRHKYRTATIFRVLMMAIMKKAVKSRLLRFNPATDLKLPPKPPKKKFYKPSADDWSKLMEYPKTPFYFWRWLLLTEYVTGARLGELLALKWEDLTITTDQKGHIHITGGTMYIQHALYQGQKKDADSPHPFIAAAPKPSRETASCPCLSTTATKSSTTAKYSCGSVCLSRTGRKTASSLPNRTAALSSPTEPATTSCGRAKN